MYVVKTTKSTREETPIVDIQFHPNIEEKKTINKDNLKTKKTTVRNICHSNPNILNTARNITQDDKSFAYLLRDLNVPFPKQAPKETILSAEYQPKSEIGRKSLLEEGMKDKSFHASKESGFTLSNKTMKLDKKSSESALNASLLENIGNSVEDLNISTFKQDHLETSSDTVYHVIELSGNDQTMFDSSCFNDILYAKKLPPENEGTVNQKKISKRDLSAPAMVVGENVAYPREFKRSKYDSSQSKLPLVKRFTAEELACMGKTPFDLVYKYSGRKKLTKPEQHNTKPYGKGNSPELKENTGNFVNDSENYNSENDNRIRPGCEELEPLPTKGNEYILKEDLSDGKGITDETNKTLALEKAYPHNCNFIRKMKKNSPISSDKKMNLSQSIKKDFSRSFEKDETGEFNIHNKQFDCYSEDDIGTNQSDVQPTYWQDICKCFHYGTKSVIKIAPVLKSMIKQKVCVIEVEVEDSLKVGMIKKMGGAYGKEMYYFTIENQTEKGTKKNRKLSSSYRKSAKAKFSKSKKDPMTSKARTLKNIGYKSKNNVSKIFEPEKGANKEIVKDNISTLPQDIYIKEEIADPYFESTRMNYDQKSSSKQGVKTTKVGTLRDSNNESLTSEQTFYKEYDERTDNDSMKSYAKDCEIKRGEVFEQNGNEKCSEKQHLLRNKDKKSVVNAKQIDLNKKIAVNIDKVLPGDRLTELKELYLKKSEETRHSNTDDQSNNWNDKDNAIPGENQDGNTPIKRYTIKTDEKGTKVYHCNNCEYSTSKYESAQYHIMDHTGQRSYLCHFCGTSFKRKSNLDNHKQMHSGAYLFDCQFCKKGFNDRGNFKRHLKRHIGLKEHSCEYCDYSFVSSSDLKKHMRGHTRVQPNSCDICSRSFKDTSSLNRHVLKHTQAVRFMCGVTECDSSFLRKDQCVLHIKQEHPDVGEVCVIKVDVSEPLTHSNTSPPFYTS